MMLLLTIFAVFYTLIHLGAKRAVDNYDGGYGIKDTHQTGLKSAAFRIPSNKL